MSLIARMLPGGGAESRATPENPQFNLNDPAAWDALGAGSPSSSGVRVNRETALKYSAVFRAMSLISGYVGKVPLVVYKRVKMHGGEGKEKDTAHPSYYRLRRKPNSEMTDLVWKQLIQSYALLEGNGYSYIFRNGDSSVDEIIPLKQADTYPVRVNGKLWYVTTVNGQQRKLAPQDVHHIRGMGDGLVGYSVLAKARDAIGKGSALEDYGSKFFSNNAEPRVVLEHPGKMGPEAIKTLLSSWNTMHQGIENAHKTAVLEEGMKANKISISAKDSQLIESAQFNLTHIANFFGLPPHKVGGTGRTAFASLEQENQSTLDDCYDYWFCVWEAECWDKCLTEDQKQADSHVIEFTRQALVRANFTERMNGYALGINNRVFNPNECRAMENLPPFEGGNEFLVPLNIGRPGGNPDANPPTKDSQAGEDPAAPADEPSGGAEDQARAARDAALVESTRAVLLDAITRMVKRLGVHARKAAKQPDKFADAIVSMEAEHQATIAVAIDSAELAWRHARRAATTAPMVMGPALLLCVRKRLHAAAESAPVASLAPMIELAMTDLETNLPAQLLKES